MQLCPYCQKGFLREDTVTYPISDTVITNVPARTCSCGQVIVDSETLQKMMDHINTSRHAVRADWSEIQ